MTIQIESAVAMQAFGEKLGRSFVGGEVVELVGDVGAGKTTLTKGIGLGLGINEDIQSPSFTISRVYSARDGLELAHYDFYRLHDTGIMAHDLAESISDSRVVTVIEWAAIAENVLPAKRLQIRFTSPSETERLLEVNELSAPKVAM